MSVQTQIKSIYYTELHVSTNTELHVSTNLRSQVHSWSSKHTGEDIYIMYVYIMQLQIFKIINNC